VSGEFQPGERLLDVKGRLLQAASVEAIENTVGSRVQASTGYVLESRNQEIDEQFRNRMKVRSTGLVRKKVVGEQIVNEAEGRYLKLKVSATVCVPRQMALLKQVVRIGDTVNLQGNRLTEFRDLMAAVFSSSPGFVLSAEGDDFADLVVTGRLNRIELKEVAVAAGTAPGFIKGSGLPTRLKRISVSVTAEAYRLDDDSLVSHTEDGFRNYRESEDSEAIAAAFTRELMEQSIQAVHDKLLLSREDGGKVPPAYVFKSRGVPEW